MIYEALTAGCRVGVIAMDRLKQDRITNSVDILLEKKLIANVFDINLLPEGQVLQEADRVVYQLTK
ncbi:nucleoside-diphosphate-sugar epimerase [Acinetobacter baumannii]|nr:nucleoside-diphosphate-sugar epimerase [Acinetobacter baumannii]SSR94837.1 nucleoside-diphosphate-sugar epimerase [Acinetobacter baumannii]